MNFLRHSRALFLFLSAFVLLFSFSNSVNAGDLFISEKGELLYSTDFSSLKDWRVSAGRWERSGDSLLATQGAGETHAAHMVMKRNDFTDIIIEFEAQLGEASTVQMTIDDRPKKLGRITLDLKKFTGIQTHRLQKTQPIEKTFNAVEGPFVQDQWYTIQIEMVNNQIVALIGDEFSSSIDNVWSGKPKRLGLYAKKGPGKFRNLKIWNALPKQQ
ncbi:MAG: hypothetical protein ABF330_04185 [Lentimonas sp.]